MEATTPESSRAPTSRCWAEIELTAILCNARTAQAMTGASEPAVVAIIKADAYGHGAVAVGSALENEPCVRAFGVANVVEGMELRDAGIARPIYVLGPVLPEEISAVVEQQFIAPVSTLGEADQISAEAERQGVISCIYLVVDTGMGRIGALPSDAIMMVENVSRRANLTIESIASHLPSADEDQGFTERQLAECRTLFARMIAKNDSLEASCHIANSACTMGYSSLPGEWVRAGLMLYGCAPIARFQTQLQPALTWKTRVSLVRDLPVGQGVSYGRTFITQRPTVAATITVGYGDGYPRHLSNTDAKVLIRGVRCPILGRVTMDQIVVDVTDLEMRLDAGEEVVLLGAQGAEEISAAELAEKAGTIPWEIFTGISKRVNRTYVTR